MAAFISHPASTDQVQYPPIRGLVPSFIDCVFQPDHASAMIPLRELVSAFTMTAPKITLRLNPDGVWCRFTNTAYGASIYLSPVDYCTEYRYMAQTPTVDLHVHTHELDHVLSHAEPSSIVVLRVAQDDYSSLHINIYTQDRNEVYEVACAAEPHDPASSGAWIPGELANMPTLNRPSHSTAHLYSPRDCMKALRLHKNHLVSVSISRTGRLSLTSECGGTLRETYLAQPPLLDHAGQYIAHTVYEPVAYPTQLLSRLLRSILNAPRQQFSVHADASNKILELLCRVGFYSHVYYYIAPSDQTLSTTVPDDNIM